MQRSNLLTVFLLSGAYIAYLAGSGFGSGQEIMQYFMSYGYIGIVGILLSAILWGTYAVFIVRDSREFKLTTLHQVYIFYCGKYLGNTLFVFSIAYLFCMASLMIAGSGAAFSQYFGVGNEIGRIIMTVFVLMTGLLGMRRMVDVIGSIGPCIIVFVMLIAIIALLRGPDGLEAGNQYIITNDLLKPSTNWLWAAIMYFSYCILFQASYLSGLATTNPASTSQLTKSVIIGAMVYVAACIIMLLAFMANITDLHGIEVPTLHLGTQINPILGAIYGVVLVAALYTTSAPLIWAVTNVFSKEKTHYYKWVLVATTVLAYLASGISSFSVLVNIVTTVAAYVGILYIVPVFYVKTIKRPRHLKQQAL
ncbi:YkvI family membrane protein [Pseudochrobactrum sp. HB0163]|uniref:YkvI family membrane protein n=1 Tax=Pseudochrobactrum sp. HB0163 TaxID=3450708 RepID=UPI003F6DC5EE